MSELAPEVLEFRRRMLLRRPRKAAIAILAGFGIFLVGVGVWSIALAFCACGSVKETVLLLLLAATTLAVPVWLAVALLWRRMTKDRWLPTEEERLANFGRLGKKRSFLESPSGKWVWALSNVAMAAVYWWLPLSGTDRRGHGFTSWYSLMFAVIWTAFAVHAVWALVKRRTTAPPQAQSGI